MPHLTKAQRRNKKRRQMRRSDRVPPVPKTCPPKLPPSPHDLAIINEEHFKKVIKEIKKDSKPKEDTTNAWCLIS